MSTLKPTNGSGKQTPEGLRTHSYTGKEYIADRVKENLFLLPNFVAAADLVSMGAGDADLDEINATELAGIECATTESYSCWWILPDEIVLSEDIDVRVLWCSEAADSTKDQTMTATYDECVCNSDALVAPATALDTVIADQGDIGADKPLWTAFGTITGGTLTSTPGEDLCNWKFKWTLDTLAAAWTIAAQARYYRCFVGK